MTEAILARCRSGEISPAIALSQLLIMRKMPDAAGWSALGAEGDASPVGQLVALATADPARTERLAAVVASGIDPLGTDVAATAALFDRLATEAPEAAVAFYSLGDPALLDRATAELVEVIEAWAPLAGRDVLDLGCGIGRVALGIAPRAATVLALDVSPGMIAEAQRRGAGVAGVRFAVSSGRDLAGVASQSIDLLLAVDILPFVVRAGLTDAIVAEVARVLRPGGSLLVFNWSYRHDAALDCTEAATLADRHGFALVRAGERPFAIWDGVGFHLVRSG